MDAGNAKVIVLIVTLERAQIVISLRIHAKLKETPST